MSQKTRFSPEILKKIKDSTNIIEIIGEHVVLRKSGSNYTGLCPFHSERTPSFSVSESKQLYHCYGCKKGGDLVSFVTEILGISFIEAVEELADRAKISLPSEWNRSEAASSEEEKKRAQFREKQAMAFKLNRFAAAFFHNALPGYPVGMEYLTRRGIPADLSRLFYLGASSDAWDNLSRHLITKKAPVELAMELGLVRPSSKKVPGGPGYFDLLRGRVIFPILNMFGKVAGFGGRDLVGDTPKYLNSPESLVFQKSKLAFGLYQAQKHIRELDEIILVEGYFDVLALQAAGFKNVVATCGTSLTPDHLTLFNRLASRVTVLFDGDKAGITATDRAMETGLDRGMVLYGAKIPIGLDPDEVLIDSKTGLLLPQGKEQMTQILKDAQPILDTRIEAVLKFAEGSSENRTQGLKKIGEWLGRFQDTIGREVRLQLVQDRLSIPRSLLIEAMGKPSLPSSHSQPAHPKSSARPASPTQASAQVQGQSSGSATNRPQPRAQARSQPKAQAALSLGLRDRILLSGISFGGDYAEIFMEALGEVPPGLSLADTVAYPPAREFVASVLAQPGQIENFRKNPEIALNQVNDAQVRSTLTESLVSGEPLFSRDDFRGSLHKGITQLWARFSQQIKQAMTDAEVKQDIEIQVKLMKEYLDVQRKMKDFNNFYDEE